MDNRDRLRPWPVLWTVVYGGNLLMPLLWGLDFTRDGGRVGMMLAIGAMWVPGLVASVLSPFMGRILVMGGTFVAVTQVVPVLQMMAGALALNVWLGPSASLVQMQGLSEVGGFAVTAMTGAPLMLLALLSGLATHAILAAFGPNR